MTGRMDAWYIVGYAHDMSDDRGGLSEGTRDVQSRRFYRARREGIYEMGCVRWAG